jgi:hypothetical protein
MDGMQYEPTGLGRASRTSSVLIFLAAFSVIVSWLACYAVTNALISTDMMSAWPAGEDPRPHWMLNSFIGLFGSFALVALVFRWSSNRQLRRIDAMADGEE